MEAWEINSAKTFGLKSSSCGVTKEFAVPERPSPVTSVQQIVSSTVMIEVHESDENHLPGFINVLNTSEHHLPEKALAALAFFEIESY